MRWLFGVLIVAVLGWGGYWWFGSQTLASALATWFEDRQEAGWVAEYGSLSSEGFPIAFQSTLTDVSLADPDTGWAWRAPSIDITAQSHRPGAFNVVWPEAQELQTLDDSYEIVGQSLTTFLHLGTSARLPLREGTAQVGALAVTSETGWELRASRMGIFVRQHEDAALTYEVEVNATNLRPDDRLQVGIDLDPPLPDAFETLSVSGRVTFDKIWDRTAIEDSRPQPTRIDLALAEGKWGQLELRATGSVRVDAEGYPTGDLDVQAKNWRDMIAVAVATGAISDSLGRSLESGLGLLAAVTGNSQTLDIPLRFGNRLMSIGPVPVGNAPQLRLR